MIEVLDPGRMASIQDRGRPGLERFGVTPGGAADWFSAGVANRLVGNHRDAAVIEFAESAPVLHVHADATIAITGADLSVAGGHPAVYESWRAHRIEGTKVVGLGKLGPGLRGYVAVRGGFDVPIVLDSRSLDQRGQFGGGFGRQLHTGDVLPIGNMADHEVLRDRWPLGHRLPPWGPWEVRVIAGPHLDAFGRGALDRLTVTACRITPAIDRMGLRMQTPGLRLEAEEILTTPVTAGAIQVTPSGELIALLVDHPTTGGYPVIATVITADLPLLAQSRPGDTIRFRQVVAAEAARALRRLRDWLN